MATPERARNGPRPQPARSSARSARRASWSPPGCCPAWRWSSSAAPSSPRSRRCSGSSPSSARCSRCSSCWSTPCSPVRAALGAARLGWRWSRGGARAHGRLSARPGHASCSVDVGAAGRAARRSAAWFAARSGARCSRANLPPAACCRSVSGVVPAAPGADRTRRAARRGRRRRPSRSRTSSASASLSPGATSKTSSSCTCSSIRERSPCSAIAALDAEHRDLDQVGRRALDRRVERHPLGRLATLPVVAGEVGQVAPATHDRLGEARAPGLVDDAAEVVADAAEGLEVLVHQALRPRTASMRSCWESPNADRP